METVLINPPNKNNSNEKSPTEKKLNEGLLKENDSNKIALMIIIQIKSD